MRILAEVRERVLALVFRTREDREMDAELGFHVQMQTEQNVRAGMSPKEARRQAVIALGGVERFKEEWRDARGTRWLEDLAHDLRYAVRTLRRTPGFTLVVILTLALGIGANTAIFSIVDAVLLDPLPYPNADRLVTIARTPWVPADIALDLRHSARSFEAMAAYSSQPFTLTGEQEPYEVPGAHVTPNFFAVLRARMALGRTFMDADARPDAPATAIISYGLWQRRFGGSPDVVGRVVHLNGAPHVIIGVLGQRFRQFAPHSESLALWVPFEVQPTTPANSSSNWVIPLARLKAGASLQQAQRELNTVTTRFSADHPDWDGPRQWTLQLTTLKSELVRNVRPALLLVQLAVAVVLLLACVNVANLLLARFSVRRREMAMRSALGASTGRLVRQLLSESVLISMGGGAAGLLLMLLTVRLIVAVAPADIPRIGDVSVNVSVLLFTLGISIAGGLAFGIMPALVMTRRTMHGALKEGGRAPVRSTRQHQISQALIVAEVSLTLTLLVSAGLLVRSFVSLTAQAPGFRTENVLAIRLHVPENRYQSVPRLTGFYERVLARLQRIPGIESLALSNNVPITRGNAIRDYVVEGTSPADAQGAQYGVVSPDYFPTLDIPLVKGRAFDDADRTGTEPVAIIDEAMWRAAWPQQDPIGKRFRFEDGADAWRTVVAVVANIRGNGLASDPHPGFYIPYRQRPETSVELAVGHDVVLLARARTDAVTLSTPVRRGIWEVDPQQPVPDIETLQRIVSNGTSPQRFRAVLLGVFAVVALLLAVAGIYGVVQYLVSERTHEFGIRMVLGATSGEILASVLRWSARLVFVGVALGLLAVVAVNRYLENLLFGVTPTDPVTVLTSVGVIVLVTLAACLIPAHRAARSDPGSALREDVR